MQTFLSRILMEKNWKPEEVREVEEFLTKSFVFVPIDRTVSRMAASIRRTVKIKTPDATIAATAILTNTPLITRNTKDFKNVSGITLQTI